MWHGGTAVALAWVTGSPETRCVGGSHKESFGLNTRKTFLTLRTALWKRQQLPLLAVRSLAWEVVWLSCGGERQRCLHGKMSAGL